MKKRFISICVAIIMLITLTGSVYATNTSNTTTTNSTSNTTTNETTSEDKSNKYLSELSIDGYDMYPEFSKNTLTYYVIIPEGVTSLDVTATAEAEGAKVKISGSKSLKKQENTITVRVTAVDGTSRTYTIIASRETEVTLKLTSLEIEGLDLSPEFESTTFYYTASIEDTELTSLTVNAVASDETATIEIVGADSLVDGENLINIILTNDEEITIYQVNVDVDMLGEKEKEANNIITKVRQIYEYVKLGAIAFAALLVLIIIIVIIVKRHKKKKEKR